MSVIAEPQVGKVWERFDHTELEQLVKQHMSPQPQQQHMCLVEHHTAQQSGFVSSRVHILSSQERFGQTYVSMILADVEYPTGRLYA